MLEKVIPGRGIPDGKTAFDPEGVAIQEDFFQDEVEPNNTRAQANQMDNSRVSGGEYGLVGTITGNRSDVDYYKFTVQTGGIVDFGAYWVGSIYGWGWEDDLFLTLYDSTGKELATQSLYGSGGDMFCYIFHYINAGTYYLKVSASQAWEDLYVGKPYVVFTEFYRDTPIPDANLRNVLLPLFEISGRNITELDMWRLQGLDISGKGIRNLSGMEDAWNLEMLYASNNQITNVAPLAPLPKLAFLDLNKNAGLTSLLPLAGHNGLENLQFGWTSVADLAPVKTMPKLVAMAFGGDWFCDLTQVNGMTNLIALALVDSPMIQDLTPIGGLNNLEHLIIQDTLIQDISPLTNLQNLWALILRNNRITDLSPLATWSSGLVDLDLSYNEITDIGPIVSFHDQGALSENSVLDLRCNDLDLSPGSQTMTQIEYLQGNLVDVLYEPQEKVARIAGANRYRTAIAVSREGWLEGADTVILARGDNFADALAGVPLAYCLDAPILLTAQAQVGAVILAEIERLGAEKVIILGGTGAVSGSVESTLIAEGLTVERIAGVNRFETAKLIAQAMAAAGANIQGAVVAVGSNFPDALAAASYAAMNDMPILLTASNYLPGVTADAIHDLGISELLIVGGLGVINGDVEADLASLAEVERISGVNRYATALALAEKFDPVTDTYFIATGTDFPDAITGAVLAAKRGTGVLLVYGAGSAPSPDVQTFLLTRNIRRIRLFGGASVISSTIENWFWGDQ